MCGLLEGRANIIAMRRRSAWLVLVLAGAACLPAISRAQEIEPRAYAASPTGVTFVGLAYGRSTGAVLTDPSLPVDDVEAEINAAGVGVGHTFGFFGRLASATMTLPYVRGDFTGTLDGEPAEANRAGMGDVKLRLAMNFIGTPALTPAEFAKRAPTTTLGASLTVSLPTGEYHGDKLINIGTNRWAIKPEIGVSQPIGRWFLEAYAGAWFFGDNDNFFGGRHREQEPLTSIQAHVAYVFRPRLWLALDGTYYDGGRSTVDGVRKDDRQTNSRVGMTLAVPIGPRQALKFSWSQGASTRIGSDFTAYGIAWQYTHIQK